MGRRGPKPQPTALKLERGVPSHHRLNHDEPEFPPPSASATAPPRGLVGAAIDEWNAHVDALIERGVLTVADMSQFRQYCWMFGEAATLEDQLAKPGRWTERRTKMSAHLSKLHARLTQQAAHFGLTPSTRSSIQAVKPAVKAKAAELEEFFGKGKRA